MEFLPKVCANELPESFSFMNVAINSIPLSSIREEVDRTESSLSETPSIDDLTLEEQRYLYSIMCMMFHRYIWLDTGDVKKVLPPKLGGLWLSVSEKLGIAPVLTHAAVDLWNWSIKDTSLPISLDNLKSNHLMLSGKDAESEEWFYLVMVAIEHEGAPLLRLFETLDAGAEGAGVEETLREIKKHLAAMTALIKRMYEKCDPSIFFNKLRVFLGGSSKKEYFPEGLQIGERYISYVGGSAAQSTLIQVIDAFFGVKHPGHGRVFLDSMVEYMPLEHREYLKTQQAMTHWKPTSEHEAAYNDCIQQLTRFRQAHLGLVHEYIMKFVGKHDVSEAGKVSGTKGTGETDPASFCKELVVNTMKTKLV